MTVETVSIQPHIDNLLSDYKKSRQFAVKLTQELIFTSFFEKLIRILGWDPWASEEYSPFTITMSHEVYYGAQLFLPNGERILAVLLKDEQVFSPAELKRKNIDMSFAMREAFLSLHDKFSPSDVKIIWFSSITKNYLYHFADENPLYFFSSSSADYENVRRTSISSHLLARIRYRTKIETGVSLAFWLKKWEERLKKCKELKYPHTVHHILDFLVTITLFGRSNIHDTDKNLLEKLLIKYHLKEFFMKIDFINVIPRILEDYRNKHNFRFYENAGDVKYLKNPLIALLIEEIVCHSKIVFSLESLGVAYYLLEKENIFNEVKKTNMPPDRICPIPVLSREVQVDNRSAKHLRQLRIRVDGEDPGLVLGLYDSLEAIYQQINMGLSGFHRDKPKNQYSFDLFENNQTLDFSSYEFENIPVQILEKNIQIVNTTYAQRRTLYILLIKKIITSMEANPKNGTYFPSSLHFQS